MNFIIFFMFLLVNCFEPKTNYSIVNAKDSIEKVLIDSALAAKIGKYDELEKILLTRNEHNDYFWNHVGERFTSDPGMTADMAYEFMQMETKLSFGELSKSYPASLDLGKIKTTCVRKSEIYGPFTLHLGCRIIGKDEKNKEIIIRNFNGVIQYKDKFKLYHMKRN